MNSRHNTRDIYPPTGTEITAKSWLTEAPMRMLMNNLHPDVAENPHELVVYGGIGRAVRTWARRPAPPVRVRMGHRAAVAPTPTAGVAITAYDLLARRPERHSGRGRRSRCPVKQATAAYG